MHFSCICYDDWELEGKGKKLKSRDSFSKSIIGSGISILSLDGLRF